MAFLCSHVLITESSQPLFPSPAPLQVRRDHEELRKRRLDEFMAGFNVIGLKLKEMYQVGGWGWVGVGGHPWWASHSEPAFSPAAAAAAAQL